MRNMRTFTFLRGQMWLLPFLAVSMLQAQAEFGVSAGGQLAFLNVEGYKGSGAGFVVGGALRFPLSGNLGLRGDLLLSYESAKVNLLGFANVRYNRFFMKLPFMLSYTAEMPSLTLEGGAGLQPNFLLSSTVRSAFFGEPIGPVQSEFDGGGGPRRLSLSLALMGGLRFQQVGVYLRFDPMLTSLYDDGTARQSTLAVMATYWLSGR